GVKWLIVTDEVQGRVRFREVERDPERGQVLVELPRSLPRAYAVHRALPAANEEEARSRLLSDAFKPGREAIIETPAPEPSWALRPDTLAVPVTIVSRTNATVTIDADLPWDGFVVLNEATAIGWSAWVDGTPAEGLIANAAV